MPQLDESPTRATARRIARSWDRRALACLLVGFAALAIVLAVVLSRPAQPHAGTNGVWPRAAVAQLEPGRRICQDRELLPAGAAAIELAAQPLQRVSQRISVTLSRRGQTIESTSAVLGGRLIANAPLTPRARDLDDVTVCLTPGAPAGRIALVGGPTPPDAGSLRPGGALSGASLSLSYRLAPVGSRWERLSAIADHLALGRGDWGGVWLVWLLGALLLGSVVLVAFVLLRAVIAVAEREPSTRRVPRLAWTIAAVAVVNAAAWSLITPPFQVPDEQTHIAYAQYVAETGRPPVPHRGHERLAPELLAAMGATRFGNFTAGVDARTLRATVWSPLQQQRLERDLHAGLARRGNEAGPATPEPPLYYALEAIPYRVASSATLLDRIALMRLLSAALAGATALFSVLFVRECLPGRAWAWWIAGLAVALTPILGFVSGGVNPDALLFPLCAALFYSFAVAFRRGLTTRRAMWIGGLIGVGVIAKINFYGLVPGALLALALAARASAGGVNRRSIRLFAIAVGLALAPYLLLTALDMLVWDRAWVLARTPAERPEDHGDLAGQLSYMWQLFLPRLPGQSSAFDGSLPVYDLLFKGFVGRFGWLTIEFPPWVYTVATALAGAVLLLAARAGVRHRAALRRRRPELLGYAAMAGGLMVLLALVALRGFAPGLPGALQGRYLLPLLALLGAVVALAVRGAGERWGRAVGVALVLTCVAWNMYSQLLMISWFYG
ncbi:MAG TPA: DUF2142 domain-containing protein [Conexibacter sp.]|nr:DUF2142 domain-containing protein [Conexibacter sp.]